jgi:hypothetical protein
MVWLTNDPPNPANAFKCWQPSNGNLRANVKAQSKTRNISQQLATKGLLERSL